MVMSMSGTSCAQGHIGLDQAVFPEGTHGLALDILARAPLWGMGLNYRHGTGHGVGAALNVHEGPQSISHRLACTQSAPEACCGRLVQVKAWAGRSCWRATLLAGCNSSDRPLTCIATRTVHVCSACVRKFRSASALSCLRLTCLLACQDWVSRHSLGGWHGAQQRAWLL